MLDCIFIQHIASATPRDGFSGIIEKDCSPVNVIKEAIEKVSFVARSPGILPKMFDLLAPTTSSSTILNGKNRYHYGDAPKVDIIGDRSVSFTYIPVHLHYIVMELLKNSMRATLEAHAEADQLPPIKVRNKPRCSAPATGTCARLVVSL